MATPPHRLRSLVFTTIANGQVHPQLSRAHRQILSDLHQRHLERDRVRRRVRRRIHLHSFATPLVDRQLDRHLFNHGSAENPINVDEPKPVNPFHVVHLVAEGTLDDDCSICQEPIKKGQDFARLHCSDIVNHCYHKHCITPWLQKQNTCPVCRADLSRDTNVNLEV